jgi:hypothetical protein
MSRQNRKFVTLSVQKKAINRMMVLVKRSFPNCLDSNRLMYILCGQISANFLETFTFAMKKNLFRRTVQSFPRYRFISDKSGVNLEGTAFTHLKTVATGDNKSEFFPNMVDVSDKSVSTRTAHAQVGEKHNFFSIYYSCYIGKGVSTCKYSQRI